MTDFDVPGGDDAHEAMSSDVAHDYGHADVHDGALHRYSDHPEPDYLMYDSDGDGDMDTIFVDSDHDGDIDMIRHLPDSPDGIEEEDVPDTTGALGPPQDNLGYTVDTDGDGHADQAVTEYRGHETVYEDLDHDGDVDRVYQRDSVTGIDDPRRF